MPWYWPSNLITTSRPVSPRASRMACIVASVPVLVKRIASGHSKRLHHLLGCLDLPTLGHGEAGRLARRLDHRSPDIRIAVTEDDRPESALVVDVVLAVHVDEVPRLAVVDDQSVVGPPIPELARHPVDEDLARPLVPLPGLISLEAHYRPCY